MGVIQYPIPIPVTVGVGPNLRFMVCTDNETTITTPGYLNSTIAECATPLSNSDVIFALTSYNVSTRVGVFAIYTVSINGATGQITLTAFVVPGGGVVLPVTVGDFAIFNNIDGQLADKGYLPSNSALTRVVMSSGTIIANDIPQFADIHGTVSDSGIAASNIMQTNIANNMVAPGSIVLPKVSGTISGTTITLNGVAGVINTPTLTTAPGASFDFTWTNSYISATSVVLVSVQALSNPSPGYNVYPVVVGVASNLALINVINNNTSALSAQVALSFLVL